ncbi:hypothetical protein ACOMHN_059634 [Nucella lapillus]
MSCRGTSGNHSLPTVHVLQGYQWKSFSTHSSCPAGVPVEIIFYPQFMSYRGTSGNHSLPTVHVLQGYQWKSFSTHSSCPAGVPVEIILYPQFMSCRGTRGNTLLWLTLLCVFNYLRFLKSV